MLVSGWAETNAHRLVFLFSITRSILFKEELDNELFRSYLWGAVSGLLEYEASRCRCSVQALRERQSFYRE